MSVEASVVWKDDVPRQVDIIVLSRQDGCGRLDFYTRHPASPWTSLTGEPRPTWGMETSACDGTRPVACAEEHLAMLERQPTRLAHGPEGS